MRSGFPSVLHRKHGLAPEGVWASLPLLATHLALLVNYDLAEHLVWTLSLLALGFAALWAVARRRLEPPPSAAGVLLVALLLRLFLIPLPPTLSDDLLRYIWDGRVADAGFNPYQLAPEAEELTPLRDALWERMPHKEVPTVYPPVAIGAFSIASLLPWPFLGLKALLVAADLGTCWVLLLLARHRGIPESRTLWYAWNPLVTLEVAGMGHVDALGGAAVALALLWLSARPPRPLRAGVAAAAGVLIKLAPLAALPMWSLRSGKPPRFLAVTAVILAAVGLPVLAATGGIPPGLITYGISWEYNGPVYEPLWRLLDAVDADVVVKGWLDLLKEATHYHPGWNRLYPFVYPQLLAKLLLAPGLLAVVLLTLRQRDPVVGTRRLFSGLLLLASTFYPWYLLWVLPWAALSERRAWLALSALLLLSYVPQHTSVPLMPWIFCAIWLPFWGLLLADHRCPSTA